MKVLVVKLSAIGDVIHALPAVSLIKESLPGVVIDWVVEPAASAIVKDNPIVDDVILFDKQHFLGSGALTAFSRLGDLRRELAKRKYDLAVDFQGLLKSSAISFLSGARRRVGFGETREFAHLLLTDRLDVGDYFSHEVHVVDLNMRLARLAVDILSGEVRPVRNQFDAKICFPLPRVSEEQEEKIERALATLNKDSQGKRNGSSDIAVLIPGTTWITKIWPAEKWISLGCELVNHQMRVAIIGGAKESEVNARIARAIAEGSAASGAVLDLTGQTSLTDLVPLFEKSSLVIGCDTGPLHLACAVNKPLVLGVYGSTPPGRNGPYGNRCLSVSLGLDCQPCFSKTCRIKTLACLNDLSAETVFQKAMHLMSSVPQPGSSVEERSGML